MEIDELVGHLSELRARLEKKGAWSNPALLSTVAGRMSTYNSYLGEYLPRLETNYLRKRGELYTAQRKSGASIGDSENHARTSTLDERQKFEAVKQLHRDTQTNISVIQSHLKILVEEQRSNI